MKHRDPHVVTRLSNDMAQLLRRVFGQRVLGPDTPMVSRIQLQYIRKVVLKIETAASMAEARQRLRQIQQYLLSLPEYKSAQVVYDVDPV
jgi:primosomal protein N' (replication factor Y)